MKTDTGIVCTRAELPKYLEEYHCKDEQDLRNLLFFEYGVDLTITEENEKNSNH